MPLKNLFTNTSLKKFHTDSLLSTKFPIQITKHCYSQKKLFQKKIDLLTKSFLHTSIRKYSSELPRIDSNKIDSDKLEFLAQSAFVLAALLGAIIGTCIFANNDAKRGKSLSEVIFAGFIGTVFGLICVVLFPIFLIALVFYEINHNCRYN